MSVWTVKKRFDFPSETVRHINWESFVSLVHIWGRLVIEKNFETGAMSVEALTSIENAVLPEYEAAAPPSVCPCEQCRTIRAKEQQRA